MGIINILDKQTANLIAAGEVVERPSSAVKELLENCADAGCDKVTVEIKNGGTSYIRVTDNGIGMSKEDLQNCILRHATSKIKSKDDLFSIGTYGFRGEALAAIAAVCDITIITKRKEDKTGYCLRTSFGEKPIINEAGCPDGTTIAAEHIFKNVPARKKFMKKDSSEALSVLAVVEKFILSRPDIAVTLISDGAVKLQSSGNSDLKSAVYSCFGREFAGNCIPVEYSLYEIRVHGFVLKPEFCRANRNMQNFFVNNRFVKSRTMSAALEESFRAFTPAGKFPCAVLFADLNLAQVDVNVHPAKTEIKFSDEKKVFEAVYFAVRNALYSETKMKNEEKADFLPEHNETFSNDKAVFQSTPAPTAGTANETQIFPPDFAKSEQPLSNASKNISLNFDNPFSFPNETFDEHLQKVCSPNGLTADIAVAAKSFENPRYTETFTESECQTSLENFDESAQNQNYRILGQAFNSYIIVEKDDNLYIIDKHAAHERIIYEEIKHSKDKNDSQMLLDPIRVTLSPNEIAAVTENEDYFKNTSFNFDIFGSDSVIIRSLPEHISHSDAADIFRNIAQKLSDGNTKAAADIFDRALFSAACKSAIKAGQKNTIFQDDYIVRKIFSDEAILYCPHGRPVIVSFTKTKLDKMFDRT